MSSFRERFQRLEIPAERRRPDLGFIEAELAMPRPLPGLDAPVGILVSGRVRIPDGVPADGAPRLLLYDEPHALRDAGAPAELEAAYREQHRTALLRQRRRFRDAIPAGVLRDAVALGDALALLDPPAASMPAEAEREPAAIEALAGDDPLPPADGSALLDVVRDARLLWIHEKLYDLVTLRSYVRIFARAIEPELLRELEAFAPTATPAELLAAIERSLDQVHKRARSPLRNKMETSRVVVHGVTLLPIYREPTAGLEEAYAGVLAAQIKRDVLAELCG